MMNGYQGYPYNPQLARPDLSQILSDYISKATQQAATGQPAAPSAVQGAAQIPTFHCQPIKSLQELDEMKWFNPTPFVGLTEDGQYVGIRRWDGAIPAATIEYYKRITQSELPQPPRPVTHEELLELLPAVLAQYIPNLLKQMGVASNESTVAAASTDAPGQLPAATGGKSKGAVGARSSEAGGDK